MNVARCRSTCEAELMYKILANVRKTKPCSHNSISNTGNMESDFRRLLLTYMYTIPICQRRPKFLATKSPLLMKRINQTKKSKEGKNPSIFVTQPVKWMNLKDSKLSVRINKLFPYRADTSVSSC